MSAFPKIFLITGIMASGKSTVAELLAQRFDRGVHLRGDVFRRMIVSGREDMTPDASAEAMRQLRLRYMLSANVADAYVEAGFTVVLQDVILGSYLADMAEALKSRPLQIVVLAPNPDIVAEREAGRAKKGYGAWTPADLNKVLYEETPRIGLWLDTSDQTPEETVEAILQAFSERSAE